MRILVDVEKIKKLASNNKVFIRGRNLFNAKERVGPLHYDGDKRLLMARISSFSGNVYDAVIHVHNNGSPKAASCSCSSFGVYRGLCKHTVALLFSSIQHEFSDDGEWPQELDADNPLRGLPYLRRPLIFIDELMEIPDPSDKQSKKKRGRPSKADEAKSTTTVKADSQAHVDRWLVDNTVRADSEASNYIPIRPKAATDEVIQIKEEVAATPQVSRSERFIQSLARWENREDNIARSHEILRRQNAEIYFEITVELYPGLADGSQLSLRVGTLDHLYVVNQLASFFQSLSNSEEIVFGTYFTWQKEQRLSDFQQYTIEWLQRNYFESKRQEELFTRHNWVNSKFMTLSKEMLRDFLRFSRQADDGVHVVFAFREQIFPLVISERLPQSLRIRIDEKSADELPSSKEAQEYTNEAEEKPYRLSLLENDSMMDLSFLEDEQANEIADTGILILHEEYICLYDSVIYMLKGREERFLWQAMLLLAESPSNRFRMNRGELSYFLSVSSGYQQELRRISLAESLEAKIIEEPLQIKSYVDFIDGVIWMSCFFFYGDHYFRPFLRDELPRTNQTLEKNRLVIRQGKAERQFETVLENCSFHTVKLEAEQIPIVTPSPRGDYMANQFYIKGDEAIFQFLSFGIQEVQAASELFVSQNFRTLEILECGEANIHLDYDETQSWLDVQVDMKGFSQEEAQKILRAYQEDLPFAKLDEHRMVNLMRNRDQENKATEQLRRLMQTLDSWGAIWVEDRFRVSKYRSFALQRLLEDESIHLQASGEMEKRWQQLIRDQQNPALAAPALPDGIHAELRPYQLQAFQWLSFLDRYGMGGILADEMGLGKTLEMLSFLWYQYQSEKMHILIIAPTSLVYNWEAEVKRFVPDLPCTVVSGNKVQRMDSYEAVIDEPGIVIVSYGVARQDKNDLKKFAFSYVIIDEAQNIKNPMTKTARAVKAIPAKSRFALTGTPIENHIGELWSIFDFIMPGYLFSYSTFQDRFSQDGAQQSLHQLVSPFIMRRLKEDVLQELPDKIVTAIPCKMTSEQQALYRIHLQRARQGLRAFDTADNADKNKKRMDILGELTRLRQICCDPSLFVDGYTGGSAKLDVLDELVESLLDGGHRILLFSQFTSMLQIIQERQEAQGRKILYIDGKVQAKARVDLVDRFNKGEGDIFLISLKAGGTGLNLTGADVVIHYDPWWNPAVENQATDRAHRLGQRKIVQVFRLVTIGSIEEKIQEMQERKQALLDDIVAPGATFIHRMDLDDIRELFADTSEEK